jgi:hypothetical protein
VDVETPGADQSAAGLAAGSYQLRAKTAQGNVSDASATVVMVVGSGSDDGDGSDDGGDDSE